MRWTINSPQSPQEFAARLRSLRRWHPARDGFSDPTQFIDERFEVEIREDAFRFVMPNGAIICRGLIHPTLQGTQVDLEFRPRLFFVLLAGAVPISTIIVVLYLFAADTGFQLPALLPLTVGLGLVAAMFISTWLALRGVRRRLNTALTQAPAHQDQSFPHDESFPTNQAFLDGQAP